WATTRASSRPSAPTTKRERRRRCCATCRTPRAGCAARTRRTCAPRARTRGARRPRRRGRPRPSVFALRVGRDVAEGLQVLAILAGELRGRDRPGGGREDCENL